MSDSTAPIDNDLHAYFVRIVHYGTEPEDVEDESTNPRVERIYQVQAKSPKGAFKVAEECWLFEHSAAFALHNPISIDVTQVARITSLFNRQGRLI